MLSYRNKGIGINIKYSKLSSLQYCMCREYRKKVESQVKLHRIITKVRKFIRFTHTKILTSAIFLIPQKFCGSNRPTQPVPKFDLHHPRTPPTLFRQLVKLMRKLIKSIPLENIRKHKGFLMFSESIDKQHRALKS